MNISKIFKTTKRLKTKEQVNESKPLFAPTLREKANAFHALHEDGNLLLLPSAWDALSAKIFERKGAKAIATTTAGIAATFGYPDGQLPKELLVLMIDRIVESVNVPVTIELEAGFGDSKDELCEIVLDMMKLGIVGINISDADPKNSGSLFPLDVQVEKIRAVKALTQQMGVPLFINARTDTYWLTLYTEQERLQATIERLKAYKEAGADGVYVPGLTEVQAITTIVRTIQLPLNLLAGQWLADLNALKTLGAASISFGSTGTRACASYLQKAMDAYLAGHFNLTPDISNEDLNDFFTSPTKKIH